MIQSAAPPFTPPFRGSQIRGANLVGVRVRQAERRQAVLGSCLATGVNSVKAVSLESATEVKSFLSATGRRRTHGESFQSGIAARAIRHRHCFCLSLPAHSCHHSHVGAHRAICARQRRKFCGKLTNPLAAGANGRHYRRSDHAPRPSPGVALTTANGNHHECRKSTMSVLNQQFSLWALRERG